MKEKFPSKASGRRAVFFLFVGLTVWVAFQDLQERFAIQPTVSANQTGFSTAAPSLPLRSLPQVELFPNTKKLEPSRSLAIAENYLETRREIWKLQPHHEFKAEQQETPLGTRVKFTVSQDGVPIVGFGISVLVDSKGQVKDLGRSYFPADKVDLSQIATIKKGTPILYAAPGTNRVELAFVTEGRAHGSSFPQDLVFRASDGQLLGKSRPRSEFR